MKYQALPQESQNQQPEQTEQPEALKEKFTFTIGYAFGWALTFEGLFSALYHLCPSKLTFQFDTAFMFVIASLIVALLYNGIDMPETKSSKNVTAKNPVAAANLFLYFLVPLFIFNYLGTMHHSEAGRMSINIPFLVFLLLWVACMAWWPLYKLFPERCSCPCNKEGSRNEPGIAESEGDVAVVAVVFYCLGLAVLIVFGIPFATKLMDFPATFLFTCISEATVAILGKGVARLRVVLRESKKSCENSQTSDTVEKVGRYFLRPLLFQVVYVLGTIGVWIAALVFFRGKRTTNKVKSPEQSRDLNQECYWLDFFDSHDIWHILSSFALLMSALLVIHVSYDPNTCENGKTEAKGNTGRNTGKKGGTRKTEANGEMDLSMPLLEV